MYIHRCIELAKLGAGNVAPNPMVGAVLVFEDKIIGEGYHQRFGKAHAEVNCINDAEKRMISVKASNNDMAAVLQKSILYVSLEPCAHFGRTPPCADLIIEKKIPKVVIGCRDPFKEVDGKGISKLQASGVEVHTGILEEDCIALNNRFFTFHLKNRPYIILKWAQTANRKIAGPETSRLFISDEITNRYVHKWRSEEAAVMIGTNTALMDDPSLNTRLWRGNDPLRVVLDMNLRLPQFLRIFNQEGKTLIFNVLKQEDNERVQYYKLKRHEPVIGQLMKALYELGIQSVLVEGGRRLIQSFIDENTWDEARVITNNELEVNTGTGAPQLPAAVLTHQYQIHSDTIRFFSPLQG